MKREKTLEKVAIVPDASGRGYRLVLAWMTGGSGREAEMLAETFATEAEAEARALADYGIAPDPADRSIDRRP